MRKNLGADDLGDLLERPLVAVLATYRRSGDVLLSPVWHEWRAGGFDVVTGHDGIKVQHLGRDPRASIVVYEHEFPYRGIEVRGEARLLTDGSKDAVRRIASRYLGAVHRDEDVQRAALGLLEMNAFSGTDGERAFEAGSNRSRGRNIVPAESARHLSAYRPPVCRVNDIPVGCRHYYRT